MKIQSARVIMACPGRTVRESQDAAYRFMQGLCGDMEG